MRYRFAALAALSLACVHATAAEIREEHPGIETSYESLTTRDGVKLRVIVTKPLDARRPLPAIQFVQWLSCDSVAISNNPRDGWSAMLRQIVRESGAIVWRTEKRGIGGSEGRCDTLDYDTELADHRDALAALQARPDVDRKRLVIFGGSIGSTYAPLLAANQDVAGVMTWGGGATTWAERMLRFERKALELRSVDASTLASEMTLRYRLFARYLLDAESPAAIAKQDPTLGGAWSRVVGTSPTAHYGRPFAFHQQAQRADWAAAWSRVNAPVLAMYGEYDWFESRDATQLIARIANARKPGLGTYIEVPRMNHHFDVFANADDAFTESNGRVAADEAVRKMLEWLRQTLEDPSNT